MIDPSVSAKDVPQKVLLFSPRDIGVIALIGGFPVGFALSLANLKRIGDTRAYHRMFWVWGVVTLALVAAGLYVPIADLFLLVINLVSAAAFYFIGKNIVERFQQAGKVYTPDDSMAAVGLGFVAWVAWFLIFSALLAVTTYGLSQLDIRLP